MSASSPVSIHPEHLPIKVNAAIDQALAEQRLVGAVVIIALNGEIHFCRAAGLAERETARPMTVDTLFRLASISKPIVSTAAMVLVAQGKLELDGNIRRWLPDFRPRLAQGELADITVRQLLSHTAGLGYRFSEADDDGPYARAGVSDGMDKSEITLYENLRRLATVPLHFAPGTSWRYSLAIDVIGAVIEQVCGQPLNQAIRALVTGPLQMNDTDFFTRDIGRLATPYVNDHPAPRLLQEGECVAFTPEEIGVRFSPVRALNAQSFPSGGAGMVGSASDLLRLLETLRQGGAPLLPAALVDEMGRDQTGGIPLPDAPGIGFGLGFSVLRNPLEAASPESIGTWSWGGVYGHSWFVDPLQELSVVALTNTLYEGMSGQFVNDLRDAIYASR
ncbi:beta-lactamase family protein [Yersinia enterocolitica]|uniref:serine hydrolase domain-containing protein n=1 Tax=Yersinia enterocolitica TaxID=630 RepID=UPI00155A6219|nr:serine hydrolase domain-containing protein [Yersinia enterocolitica]ELI8099552.1 beta-lactamase family protein [Yersinia enterocolitica]MBX9484678.1 beta-lactamase family protein [Yersinia enterocolitica]NQS93873.1 beta-lactamase family protein [Yersinia enterocolitica]NQT43601.1 beta-lactamase family protein [Yersinia enterocolitica]NQT98599.1 beta-lactamase family protein [Yersinia enterocolitica]